MVVFPILADLAHFPACWCTPAQSLTTSRPCWTETFDARWEESWKTTEPTPAVSGVAFWVCVLRDLEGAPGFQDSFIYSQLLFIQQLTGDLFTALWPRPWELSVNDFVSPGGWLASSLPTADI